MREFRLGVTCFAIAIALSSCGSVKNETIDFDHAIKEVYYNKVDAEGTAESSNIVVHLIFNEPLAVQLQQLYFRNQINAVVKVSNIEYLVAVKPLEPKTDLVLDGNSAKEYGNKAPVVMDPRFKLEPNQALLQYKWNDVVHFYKINAVEEQQ
ncbi:hypothetical protein [Flavobacterium muglaense]|uniref:Lipoprotein n=1 Tax=Flavobacterium muglaense TaxID=2764716 RepID=A0A923N2N8_9FLAO|nr:hypothetical protein [Flavobacterium muglaense]MBC5838462.1 hypothetical protein [Flavobacterium muglaense]MBC5844955.1 hypothetical protein [Flavobacterium muglaense]